MQQNLPLMEDPEITVVRPNLKHSIEQFELDERPSRNRCWAIINKIPLPENNRFLKQTYTTLQDPSSSTFAYLVHVTLAFFTLLSSLISTVETLPTVKLYELSWWLTVESVIIGIFTVETVLRGISHLSSWKRVAEYVRSITLFVIFRPTDIY